MEGRPLEDDYVMNVEPSWIGLVPYKRSSRAVPSVWVHSKRTVAYEPGSKLSLLALPPDTESDSAWVLDSQLSELHLLLTGIFVIAVGMD